MKYFVLFSMLMILLACSSNVVVCKELNGYIYSRAEEEDFDKALHRCKKQVIEHYFGPINNEDPYERHMIVENSDFIFEIIDNFSVNDKICVSIKVLIEGNEHFFNE